MPDLSDLLRQSASAEAASYQPSADLPQRIARRTLQLQRRRRGRIVGGAAAFAVVILALPLLINPMRDRSNDVGIAYGPVNITASRAHGATTTTAVPPQLLDLQAFIDNGVQERNLALSRLGVLLSRQGARDGAAGGRGGAAVLDASAARGTVPGKGGSPGQATAATNSTTDTTNLGPTTSTGPPPATTQPTAPRVPLVIVPPDHVCAGVPAVFRVTGTGADLVVWSNLQVGNTATYLLNESTSVVARLDDQGSVSSQSLSVQVIPTGTPPC